MKFAAGCFITIILFLSLSSGAQNFDIDLLRSINKNETSFKNDFSKAVANSVTPLSIAAPVTLFVTGLANHDKKLQKDAVYMTGGFVLNTIITQVTKKIVQRERPFVTYPDIIQRAEGSGYSFPSGHTSSAFYTATSLSILYPQWYVIAPSYLWAASVGYARMYQGVHYPTDVFVGAIIGAGSAWVTYKFQQSMEKKAAAKKAAAAPAL